MNITVAAGATQLNFAGTQQPLIQNLGPGDLYVYNLNDSITTNGIKLPANAVYEFPATLVEGAGTVWVQALVGTCDVRTFNVG
jgi:hypothetical protein